MISCKRGAASGHLPGTSRRLKYRNEIVMTNSDRSNDIQIDRVHNAAIRREIGDRLRISLNAERAPLTPRLLGLLDRLAATERGDARRKPH